ncbi:MAG: outer membrane protein assembly factor BamD [Saprospiraceae bacterium]|nr:outer membrane protein assembly factor BamD [Saprospiraceae bacterium]
MKIKRLQNWWFFILIALLSTSCRTEFEKIRTSNDAELVYTKAMQYYDEGEYLRSQTLFELVLNSFRGSARAEELAFKFAYTHYYQSNFILASHYFENFSNTYTSSDRREEADYLNAYSNYLLSPSFRLDQKYTTKAIELFQIFINTYPNSERVISANELINECRTKLETKEFEKSKLYYELKDYNSAVHSFENLLKDFPETKNAEEVRFLILKSAFLHAENSFFEKQQERYVLAMTKFDDFKKKFPSSKYNSEATDMLNQSRVKIKTFAK